MITPMTIKNCCEYNTALLRDLYERRPVPLTRNNRPTIVRINRSSLGLLLATEHAPTVEASTVGLSKCRGRSDFSSTWSTQCHHVQSPPLPVCAPCRTDEKPSSVCELSCSPIPLQVSSSYYRCRLCPSTYKQPPPPLPWTQPLPTEC